MLKITWNTKLFEMLMTLILISTFLSCIKAFDCPSPCNCHDDNTTILCNRTGLTVVPTDLPLNTVILNLGYNNIRSIPADAFKRLRSLKNLDLSGNQFTESSFQNGCLNVSSIDVLDLSDASYMSIPQGLPPNLSTFYFFNNPSTTLKANSFNARSIQYLELWYNQLQVIENHAFDPLMSAKEIDLRFNKLNDTSFSPMAFINNHQLTNVVFRFNNLTTLPNLALFPATLQHIDFVGNQIKVVPSFAFRTLPNLQTIEVWDGEIESLEDNAFYGLNELKMLDVTQNQVSTTLTNFTFNDLTSLEKLYFDRNKVNKIEAGAFYTMKNIEELWFSSNKLSTLKQGVFDSKFLPHLSSIYIDDNPWYCDCHLKWLRQKMDDSPNLIQDPHLIVCSGPPAVKGKSWDELTVNDFVCSN